MGMREIKNAGLYQSICFGVIIYAAAKTLYDAYIAFPYIESIKIEILALVFIEYVVFMIWLLLDQRAPKERRYERYECTNIVWNHS
jgi:hypothetical protein